MTPPPTPPAIAFKLSCSHVVDGSADLLGKGVVGGETDVRDAKALETKLVEFKLLGFQMVEFDILEDEDLMMG